MNPLLDPNVAYLILVTAFVLAILALFTPGTGHLELGALATLFLAGYSIYHLPIRWWALVILIVGVFPFLLVLRKSGRPVYMVISWLALMVGSVFLFQGDSTFDPAVHPALALVVSLLLTAFLWFLERKSLEAMQLTPYNSRRLPEPGCEGEARTPILQEGSVYLNGEMWSARSNLPIQPRSRVRVLRREGFTLIVEDTARSASQTPLPTAAGDRSAL